MILEKLYDLIMPLVEGISSDFEQLDCIYKKISMESLNIDELMDKSDQDINDFISQKGADTTKNKFRRLKLSSHLPVLRIVTWKRNNP